MVRVTSLATRHPLPLASMLNAPPCPVLFALTLLWCSEALKALDAQLGGALSDVVTRYEFKGKAVRDSPWPPAAAAAALCHLLPGIAAWG